MSFTTVQFAIFFAVVFLAYYALPRKWQWPLLLVASYGFYSAAAPACLVYLFATTLVTYLGAFAIDANLKKQKAYIKARGASLSRDEKKSYKAGQEKKRKLVVALVAIFVLGLLGVFKYSAFFLENIKWFARCMGRGNISLTISLMLPIGLSFYIFQSLGYCIDVYREEVPSERNFFKHALFVSYFPQVLQGPIGNYGRLAPQFFAGHDFDYEKVVFGAQRIAWGLFKKFMIANMIVDCINPVWSNVGDYPGFICWAAILFLYSIQLYADFSGYMDIACGCSQMLGVNLDENFQTPYFAKSIAEFWRRWHITLGEWFKNYLFYPLLRSEWNNSLRKKLSSSTPKHIANAIPTALALFIVWVLIGLWHGAAWSYVLYGLFHGSFIIIGVLLDPLYAHFHSSFPRLCASRIYSLFQILRTFSIVTIGYAIFKPADLSATYEIMRQMFSAIDGGGIYQIQYTLHHSFIKVFCWIAFMLVVDVIHYTKPKGTIRAWVHNLHWYVRWPVYILGIWLVIFYGLYGSGFEQFEYFKF